MVSRENLVVRDFRKLKVWEKSHLLALAVYRGTVDFPRNEMYGLTSQMRRSGVSVPANIAEGCGRQGNAELARFLQIAMGSASELEYHLLLASELEFLERAAYGDLAGQTVEVKRTLATFIKRLRSG